MQQDSHIYNESTEVQTLGVIRIQLQYQYFEQVQQPNFTSTIDVRRSTHRLSIFEGRHINHRSSKVDTSIIGLRRSTHPYPKVDTSIFESRHIDLRRSTQSDIDLRRATQRYSKVDTSIVSFILAFCASWFHLPLGKFHFKKN